MFPNRQVVPGAFVRGSRILVFLLACIHSLSTGAAEISVFAAASLTDALRELAETYQTARTNKIVLNLSASSVLARQIEEGAPADLFFSADEAQMDRLEKRGLIVTESRTNLLSNALVIIVAEPGAARVRGPEDLPRLGRIALGDPKAVPIGVYARLYLEKQKIWEAVEPKLLITENVRAALAAVEAGNADASIVYKTDAAVSHKIKVAFEVPIGQGPEIRYPAALLKSAKDPKAARELLRFLASDKAASVFQRYGFTKPAGR